MKIAKQAIRIVLIDDHRSVLWGLEKLINGEKPKMEVVGTATNSAEALGLLKKTSPDVILVDLDLNGESGANIIPSLITNSNAKVLVLTGARDPKLREAAILLGACGLVGKEESAETILKAIEGVHRGELWLDRATTGRIFVALAQGKGAPAVDPEAEHIASLTARERQIVFTIVNTAGASARTIAERLHISEHTLRNHLTSIYEKLGVANRLELYVYADKYDLRQIAEAKSGTRD